VPKFPVTPSLADVPALPTHSPSVIPLAMRSTSSAARGARAGAEVWSRYRLVGWLMLFAINLLGTLPWWHVSFPIVDLAEMVYQVRRLQLGYVPYRDTFTHHFLGYVAPFYAIATFTPLTPFVLKAASVSFNFATAILAFATVRELARERYAWLAAFLAVTTGWFWGWQGFGFNIQSHMAPLLALMILMTVKACVRGSAPALWSVTLCGGCLVTCDQRAAVFLLLPGLVLLSIPHLRAVRTVAVAVVTGVLVPVLAALYLWRVGAWPDFIQQTIVFPMYYRNHGLESDVPFALLWLAFVLATEPVTFVLAVVGVATVWLRDLRRWVGPVLGGGLLGAALYSIAGGRVYPYYFLLFGPFLVIVLALLPASLPARSRASRALFALLGVLGLFDATQSAVSVARTGTAFVPDTESAVRQAAAYIHAHTRPTDGVLVWGFAPQLYVLSDRFHAFRDAGLLSVAGGNFSSRSAVHQGRVPAMVAEFDRYMLETPPVFVAVYTLTRQAGAVCAGKGVIQQNMDFRRVAHLAGLQRILTRDYALVLTTEGPCDRVELFRFRQPL